MTRLGAAIAALSLLALPALGTGCAAPPARAEQVDATAWRALGSWSGTGSRQTESFDVATGALRLRWEAKATGVSRAGHFRVWLHSAISGRPLQLVVDSTGAGSGTAHAADDPRVSYLMIDAEGVDWTATLDEAVVRSAPAER
jgi:hypothetical protein